MLNASRNHATLTRANGAVTVLGTLARRCRWRRSRLRSDSISTWNRRARLRDIALVAPRRSATRPLAAVPRPRRVRPGATAAAVRRKNRHRCPGQCVMPAGPSCPVCRSR